MAEQKKLTDKQRRFVEEYCVDCNAAQAAKRAGYSEKTAYSQGSRLLRDVKISEAISERLDKLSMSASEALVRLTDWGRGSIEPFLNDNGLGVDSETAKENLHLIKKLKQKDVVRKSKTDDEELITERTIEIELHDAKDAVIQIAKIHGLYSNDDGNDLTKYLELLKDAIQPLPEAKESD